MKRVFILLIVAICFGRLTAQDEIKGYWYNTEKTSKIKLFEATNGKYYGKITWLKDTNKKDEQNPDEAKRNKLLLGLNLVKGFVYDGDEQQWIDGTIYDPESGKTYDCYMWFEGENKDVLHLKGYVMGLRFAGREVEWYRTTKD